MLGGLLIVVAAIVSVLVGTFDLVVGHAQDALNAGSAAVVLFVVGVLGLVFSYLAHGAWKDHPVTGGILLVVLAVVGWAVLGIGGSILAVVGALFLLVAGVLFLVQPAVAEARHVLATA